VDELRWTADDLLASRLDRPILVVAFRGLFDAAGSATSAVEWLVERLDSSEIGDVDPETFFDFTQERPIVEFDGHGVRRSGGPPTGFWPSGPRRANATWCWWPAWNRTFGGEHSPKPCGRQPSGQRARWW